MIRDPGWKNADPRSGMEKIRIWNPGGKKFGSDKHSGSVTLVKLAYCTVPIRWKSLRVKVKSCCCVAGRWWAALPPRPLWSRSPWRASPSRSSPVSCRRPIRTLRRDEHIWNIYSYSSRKKKNFFGIFFEGFKYIGRCYHWYCPFLGELSVFFCISEEFPQGAALPGRDSNPVISRTAGWRVDHLVTPHPSFRYAKSLISLRKTPVSQATIPITHATPLT